MQGPGPKGHQDVPEWDVTGIDSLTRQGQGLGEVHKGNVIVILLISVVAIDDDLGDGGCLRQLQQVVGARIHLPALQDLFPGPARATGERDAIICLKEPTSSICNTQGAAL